MNTRAILCGVSLALAALAAHATPTLTVGTPGDSMLSTPSQRTPVLGGTFLNFDSLTPFATYSTYSSNGISISSPDGLQVLPYSTQSGPNELFDTSSDGSADITISLASPSSALAFGIADSDPVSLTIQAIGANGALLGSAFTENLATTESATNTGNGYYILQDTSSDIYGLVLTQATGDPSYSGLALDDVQIAPTPEPSTLSLMGLGASSMAFFLSRRRQKQA